MLQLSYEQKGSPERRKPTMNKLILTLTVFASIAMPVMGGDPSLDSPPTNSDQDSLILRILKAVETHDYGTLLTGVGEQRSRKPV
jgi:hypothetical protein